MARRECTIPYNADLRHELSLLALAGDRFYALLDKLPLVIAGHKTADRDVPFRMTDVELINAPFKHAANRSDNRDNFWVNMFLLFTLANVSGLFCVIKRPFRRIWRESQVSIPGEYLTRRII